MIDPAAGIANARARELRAHDEPLVVVELALPDGVYRQFRRALALAALQTGSDRLGAQVDALCAEVIASW